MRQSSAAPSPSGRSRSNKPLLRTSKTKSPEADPTQLSSKTPDSKPPQRVRNRGVALSVAEIRKVAEGLQDQRQHHETVSSSETKTARRQILKPSPRKAKTNADESFKLPQKYEILAEFFDSLDCSIRLLRLKGSKPSFTNIRHKIECLTDRRFTHGHLAQLKFVLPEAIVLKKLLDFDERTSCMKPELHVTINPDAVESDQHGSVSLTLRKLFRKRLRDFCKSHPEVEEIPEETLPEPFNHQKQELLLDMLKTPSPSFATETVSDACAAACVQNNDIVVDTSPTNMEKNLSVPIKASVVALNQRPAAASHMPQSFKSRFSQKSKENQVDNVQQRIPSDSLQPLAFPASKSSLKNNPPIEGTKSHPITCPAKLASGAASCESCLTNCASPNSFTSSSSLPATPSKNIVHEQNRDGSLKSIDSVSTPAKLISTPARLMTATPALPPPKRHYMSPDDNSTSSLNNMSPGDNSTSSLNKLARRPPRSRSLIFDTPVKNKEIENDDDVGRLPIDDDIFDILPENLLQSIREKERIAMEERDPAISQAKRRKKILASLPKLFNMIHLMFQSINRSVITKEELVSKIISSHCDIVDRSEVEEQLNLLLELVPEWISEKLASSGDFLFCINKMRNPETIRASLEEAK